MSQKHSKKAKSSVSRLRLIRWCAQWHKKENWEDVPVGVRGIYALHFQESKNVYSVVYVGMSVSGMGIKRRLRSHYNSKRKGDKWTHFSLFAVWPNIRNEEIRELEALIGEISRKDANAISLAKQKRSKHLQAVRKKVEEWADAASVFSK